MEKSASESDEAAGKQANDEIKEAAGGAEKQIVPNCPKKTGTVAKLFRSNTNKSLPPAANPLVADRPASANGDVTAAASRKTSGLSDVSIIAATQNDEPSTSARSASQNGNLSVATNRDEAHYVMKNIYEYREFSVGDGVIKKELLYAGYVPLKKRKKYFCVLSERAFELYKTEKIYLEKGPAKYIMDLSVAFNLHRFYFDPKLKKCICLMGPDTTLVFRSDNPENDLDWYTAIVKAIVRSRQAKLSRMSTAAELFEMVYDVKCVSSTKSPDYHHTRAMAMYPNIAEFCTGILGPKRLCFYLHSVIVASRRLEPTMNGCPDTFLPPFKADALFEFPRHCIACYGNQGLYFFLRIGRGSPYQGHEVLFECESHDVATFIHNHMNAIVTQEAKRRQDFMIPFSRQSSVDDNKIQAEPQQMESLSVPSPLSHHRSKFSLDSSPSLSARDRRLMLRDCLSFAAASVELDESAPSSPFGNGPRPRCSLGSMQLDLLARLDQPRGSIHSLGGLLTDRARRVSHTVKMVSVEPGLREALLAMPKKLSMQTERTPYEIVRKSSAAVSERQAETMRPTTGSTASLSRLPTQPATPTVPDPPEKRDPFTCGGSTRRSSYQRQSSTNGLGDSLYRRTFTNESTKSNMSAASTDSHASVPISVTSANDNGTGKDDQPSTSDGQPGSSSDRTLKPITSDETYTFMEAGEFSAPINPCHVQVSYCGSKSSVGKGESRYLSDSSDSCYSSMNLHHAASQRANSFGDKTFRDSALKGQLAARKQKKVSNASTKEETSINLNLPAEDPRQRAFSLGSKTFMNLSMGLNEFTRLAKKKLYGRAASPTMKNGSGASINSSSSPTSCSNHFLASLDDDSRIRSGSFGSGRSSPFGRQPQTPQNPVDDNRVPMTFTAYGNRVIPAPQPVAPVLDFPARATKTRSEEPSRPNLDDHFRKHSHDHRQFTHDDYSMCQYKHIDDRLARAQKLEKERERAEREKRLKEWTDGDYIFSGPNDVMFQSPTRKVLQKQKRDEVEKKEEKIESSSNKSSPRAEADIPNIDDDVMVVTYTPADYHPKISVCGLIVEEKEENTDNEEKMSDTKSVKSQDTTTAEPSGSSSISGINPFRKFKLLNFGKH